MSHPIFKNQRPKPISPPPAQFTEEDTQGLLWPDTPKGSSTSNFCTDLLSETTPTDFKNNRPSPPVDMFGPDVAERIDNAENQWPQAPPPTRATASRNLWNRRVLQEIDINTLPAPTNASRYANPGL